jgi:hypothetical protein
MAMIKGFAPAPGIGVRQIVKRCNSLSYYFYFFEDIFNVDLPFLLDSSLVLLPLGLSRKLPSNLLE